jgi:hypothetical protein
MEKLLLHPGRGKLLAKALLALVGGFAFIPLAADGSGSGRLILIICILAIPLLLINLIPGACLLQLDQDGFTMKSLFKQHRYRWIDVDSFVVVTKKQFGIIPISRRVGFIFSDNYQRSSASKATAYFTRAVIKFDVALPDHFGMKPAALASLLETWRQKGWANPPISNEIHLAGARVA